MGSHREQDPWRKKGIYCPVKMSHAEYAEFAEAHTLCLCLPSGWWRKYSVRLCLFLTDKSISHSAWFPRVPRSLREKNITPADHEDLRVFYYAMGILSLDTRDTWRH